MVTGAAMTYRPPRVDEDFVLRKCAYFAKVGLWQRRADLRPRDWLENFRGEQREYAVSLLNAFLYFSDDLMLELFRGAFHSLSRTFLSDADDRVDAWRRFSEHAVLTPVLVDGRPTESGVEWLARWKRDMRLDEQRVIWPEEAMKRLLEDPTVPVVFLDDFVGSGRQMRAMWNREYNVVGHGGSYTFGEIAAEREGSELIYAPALCTEYGRGKLAEHCPQLYVNPGNRITSQHNVLAEDSVIWPEEHLAGGREFVEAASAEAGIPAEMRAGFEGLGLALGYGLSVPDATLPLIYWEEDGWKPLMRRS